MNLRFRTILVVIMAIVAAAPVFLLGSRLAVQWNEAQKEEADHQLLFASKSLARSVGQMLDTYARVATALGAQIALIDLSDIERLQTTLDESHRKYAAFESLAIYDCEHRILASSPKAQKSNLMLLGETDSCPAFSDRAPAMLNRAVIDPLTQKPVVQTVVPLRQESGKPIRYFVAALGTQNIQAMTAQFAEDVPGMLAIVIDKSGTAVAHPKDETAAKLIHFNSPLFAPFEKESAPLRSAKDETGIDMRGGASPISIYNLGWTAVAYSPQSLLDDQIIQTRREIITSSLIMLSIGILLAFLLATWLVRPIQKLARYAQSVERGNSSATPPDPGGGTAREIAILMRSTKTMVSQLKALNSEMESRVEQRTLELSKANRDLNESIEQLKKAQEQLIQAGKMAAVGTLIAGLSHEINNPIGMVLGHAQSLRKRMAPDDPKSEALAAIERQALRCAHLVTTLLDYSRQRSGQRQIVQASEILKRVADLTAPQVRRKEINWSMDIAAVDGVTLRACQTEVESVLINLVTNAIDATEPKGQVALSALVKMQHGHVGVEFAVADSGSGISKDVARRIFDPFFTTKEPGKGTGLGLAIVKRIVDSHEGEIHVESTIGQGTTFRVCLPTGIENDQG